VAAYVRTSEGELIGPIADDATWTDVTSPDADILLAGKPTNNPALGAFTFAAQDDGSVIPKVAWTYTQGAIEAEGFSILINSGKTSPVAVPTLDDYGWSREATADQRNITLGDGSQNLYYTAAVVAWRQTSVGRSYGDVIDGAGWTNQRYAERPRLAEQRNIPPLTVANRRSVQHDYAGNSVVYSEAPIDKAYTIVRIRVHKLRVGATDVDYGSGNISFLGYSTTYWVYTDDPTMAGGAVTYTATTDPDAVYAHADRYYLGKTTTPAAAGDADEDGSDGAGDQGVQ